MNWTQGRLLHTRIKRFWIDQYRVWRTALDWTVWVYFIVPGLWIGGGTYREMWLDPPDWLLALPELAVLVIPVLYLFIGRLRVFLEDADMLFLTQKQDWIRRLIAGGAIYTLVMQLFTATLLFSVMLLWFVKGLGLSAAAIVAWAVFTVCCKSAVTIQQHLIEARWRGWRRWLLQGTGSIAIMLAYGWVSLHGFDRPEFLIAFGMLALAVWFLALRYKLGARGDFAFDVQSERKARLASTDLLLTTVMERKPIIRLSRPVFFRRSGRLLRGSDAGTMLAEMRMKAWLRKLANLQLWFGFFAASTTAVLVSPGWLAITLACTLPLLAAIWMHKHWREWLDEPFIAQFKWEETALRKGASLSRFWLLVPGTAWLASLAGWQYGGWEVMWASLPLGIGFWWLLNRVLAEVMSPSNQP
jgi:ABC-2 type transport system permease protein